jgi:type I restriction enzyme S subunit
MRLRHLATIANSNVDKVTNPDEEPIRLCNYVDVYKNDRITNDLDFMSASATRTEITKFGLIVGDVLITKDSEDRNDIAVPAYVAETADDLVCGYHLALLRARPERADGAFMFWALQSKPAQDAFSNAASGVTRYGLTLDGMKSVELPCPDLPIQKAIADFLDRETARIDHLIEKKKRLVEALKAKATDHADLAVTGRNDPARSARDVESPWLSSIPTAWGFKRAKYLFQEMNRPPAPDDEVITAFRDGQVCLRRRRRSEGYTFAELEVGYQHICKNDLVIHTMDAFAGAIGVSEDDGKATGEYAVCTPRSEEASCEYYAHVLRCMARRNYIFVLCPSVRERAPRFRFVRFAPVFLPVPPREEQDRIVARISEATRGLRAVREETEVSIDRLREFRSALITAAVTGQIDVATWGGQGRTDRRLDEIGEAMQA